MRSLNGSLERGCDSHAFSAKNHLKKTNDKPQPNRIMQKTKTLFSNKLKTRVLRAAQRMKESRQNYFKAK
jgi:hypothetical protein